VVADNAPSVKPNVLRGLVVVDGVRIPIVCRNEGVDGEGMTVYVARWAEGGRRAMIPAGAEVRLLFIPAASTVLIDMEPAADG